LPNGELKVPIRLRTEARRSQLIRIKSIAFGNHPEGNWLTPS